MRGLLAGVVASIRRLLGRYTDRGTPDRATERPATCAVCGTSIPAETGVCPLCGVEASEQASERAPTDALVGARPRERAVADADHRTVGDVLSRRDVLAAHADRWTRAGRGYVVTLPDGSTRRVASKADVRALLFAQYGSDSSDTDEG